MSWINGKVEKIQQWTKTHYSIFIRAEISAFIAGQFGRIALDIDGERIARPYSFVNAPNDRLLEVYFVKVPNGPLTSQLVDLQVGDSILVYQRAAGLFTLQEVPEAETLWCLSTGTALGAFLSILRTEEAWTRFQNIVLVHAVRHKDERTHLDYIHEFKQIYGERFTYISFVSRENVPDAISGRIPQAIINGQLEDKANLTLSPITSQIMICGNPYMVKDTMDVLLTQGFKKNLRRDPGHITIENYWKA